MGGDVVIEVANLRKSFGAVRAVDDLSFSVDRGDIVGLLGANGAGKTTALRLMLGLLRPQAGSVTILGEHIGPSAKVLSRVGAMVEGPGFIPHVSGKHNLELYWRAGGGRTSDAGFDEALAISGLGDAADRRVKTYSLGMKQRLSFAQAMLGQPELLMLDEPVNGLDPQQIVDVREALLQMAAKGITVLLSSHLLWEVEQTCGHVVVIDRGRLIRCGTVAEVTSGTASAYVEVDDPHRAFEILQKVPGVASVASSPPGIVVQLGTALRSDLVAPLVAAGIRVETVMNRHSLEDAFLEMVGAQDLPPGTPEASAQWAPPGTPEASAQCAPPGTPEASAQCAPPASPASAHVPNGRAPGGSQ